jgi:hypothetical protein
MSDNETTDNTTGISGIIENGDADEVRMILGDRTRVRHAGMVRPGIKRPVQACTDAQKKLYQQMLDEGHGFRAIDEAMLKLEAKGSSRKSCLTPQNADYFTVRGEDFRRPSDADFIVKNYGDADGKVRRIPIWLPSGDLDAVIPHNFRAFDGAGNLRCVSFYDGDVLKFRYLKKETKLPAKEADWLILNTDDEDKATAACGYKVQFGGAYRVFVPGLKTAGEVVVPTRSWYGLSDAVALLKRVRGILGRFNSLLDGEPFLELVKVAENVRHEGKVVKQWIATLDLTVDPMVLARYAEPQQQAARAARAALAFGGMASYASASLVKQPATIPMYTVGRAEPEYLPVPADVAESAVTPPASPAESLPEVNPDGTGGVNPEGGTGAADPVHAAAVAYLGKLAKSFNRPLSAINAYAVVAWGGGQALEDMAIEDLRALAEALRVSLKSNKEDMVLAFDDAVKQLKSFS